jgi:hypothetical protein
MTPTHHLILAYVVGVALLWGYAAYLWILTRTLRYRERRARGGS